MKPRKDMSHNYFYKVVARKKENEEVVTLTLSLINDTCPPFMSGQYITAYFPETGVKEGKAYSISSAPHEKQLMITIKDMGVFSHRLCSLEVGDTVEGSLPYGFFYSEEDSTSLVLFSSGIGVTPLYSLVKDVFSKNPLRKVQLFYSVKYLSSALFIETLQALSHQHPSFSFIIYVTQEDTSLPWCRKGRIPVKEIVESGSGGDTEYFMCGSISFVRDTWRTLREVGVPEENMYTEAFFG